MTRSAKGPVAATKKEINAKIEEYLEIEYCTLDAVVASLQKANTKYTREGFTNLHIESVRDCGCYHACECSPSLRLFGTRLETDEEFATRVDRETKQAAEQAERDRRDFERLSKQFGKP